MKKGQFFYYDGLPCVVVGLYGEDKWVPEDHVGLWFGEPQIARLSKGGPSGVKAKVYTVPLEWIRADDAVNMEIIH